MILKTDVLASLKELPDQFEGEELIERLVFLEKVQRGLLQSEQGDVHTLPAGKEKLRKWLM